MSTTFGSNVHRSGPELEAWLATSPREEILDPDRPIIDPHHHLWHDARGRYLIDEFTHDAAGHRIVATMFAQGEAMYRAGGPEIARSLGETEFAAGQAAMSESGMFGAVRVAIGMTVFADLFQGARIGAILDRHIDAAGGRLRSIRCPTAWDAALQRAPDAWAPPPLALLDQTFGDGVAAVAERGLLLDVWAYHPQLDEVGDLADRYPDLTIVLDHCGGLIGVGPYTGHRDAVFADWSSKMAALARRPNIVVKIGGLGMVRCGFELHLRDRPATSRQLAETWQPYVGRCIELFGAGRCMFESNFPPDKQSCGYTALWNAFKRLAETCSATERDALFYETARRTYRLGVPSADAF